MFRRITSRFIQRDVMDDQGNLMAKYVRQTYAQDIRFNESLMV